MSWVEIKCNVKSKIHKGTVHFESRLGKTQRVQYWFALLDGHKHMAWVRDGVTDGFMIV